MKIYTVTDREFAPYGRVVSGLDTADLLKALAATPLPQQGVEYLALEPSLQSLPAAQTFSGHLVRLADRLGVPAPVSKRFYQELLKREVGK